MNVSTWIGCILAGVAALCAAPGLGATVETVPAPQGATLSTDYTVTVNGKPVSVYLAPVWEPGYVKSFGGPYSFASFDFSGSVRVEVTAPRKPLDHLVVQPLSQGVKPTVRGNKLAFTLTRSCRLSIEPDGKQGPLLLFANPMETDRPSPADPGVKYYGPGLHKAGLIELGDNEILYLAAGAVVQGGVHAKGRHIRIRGRGILDGGQWPRFGGPGNYIMHLDRCTDVVVEGIILKDSWSWVFVTWDCANVTIRNVKTCSTRCENNDGIDFVNTSHVRMSDCFIRSDDDCIAPKGFGELFGKAPAPPVEDILVERCVLWTDRAHVWRLGCESRASIMRNMTFRDIDVIHYTDPTCPVVSVQPAEGMTMDGVVFSDIRIHHEGQAKFLEFDPNPTIWNKIKQPGTTRNVVFRNVALSGGAGSPLGSVVFKGSDEQHPIENVLFDNVTRGGVKLTADGPEISATGTVRGVRYR